MKHLKYSAFFCFFVYCLSVCFSCSEPVLYRVSSRVWLVSVGLDYKNCTVNELNGTVSDALEVASCLKQIYEKKGFETSVFPMISKGESSSDGFEETDLYPGAENIKTVIGFFKPKKQDVFVFYFSGHGHIDEKGMFLVCGAKKEEQYTKLYVKDFMDTIKNFDCPCILLIDACYSGAFSDFEQVKNVQVIAACRANETAHLTAVLTEENLYESHSLFTASVLENLGWVHDLSTCSEVGDFVANGRLGSLPERINCKDFAKRVIGSVKENKQNPVFDRTEVSVLMIP